MDDSCCIIMPLGDEEGETKLASDQGLGETEFVTIPSSIARDTNAFLEFLGFEPATEEEIARVNEDLSRMMKDLGLE